MREAQEEKQSPAKKNRLPRAILLFCNKVMKFNRFWRAS
ncbi:hypothetical protein C943_01828 [Mariniradius saccharolyticus AK6]|uniref:Uncharacterized protein n=1 Tax=Mariniradius saccharolyticus AK6 TaxID=1239962 RepID=M7XAG5_9BACT|nr:hypothetical protein C943_01828 [Mariniradius saccharolyticus AK6]